MTSKETFDTLAGKKYDSLCTKILELLAKLSEDEAEAVLSLAAAQIKARKAWWALVNAAKVSQ